MTPQNTCSEDRIKRAATTRSLSVVHIVQLSHLRTRHRIFKVITTSGVWCVKDFKSQPLTKSLAARVLCCLRNQLLQKPKIRQMAKLASVLNDKNFKHFTCAHTWFANREQLQWTVWCDGVLLPGQYQNKASAWDLDAKAAKIAWEVASSGLSVSPPNFYLQLLGACKTTRVFVGTIHTYISAVGWRNTFKVLTLFCEWHLSRQKLPARVLQHGDFHWGNILVNGDEWFLGDFEESRCERMWMCFDPVRWDFSRASNTVPRDWFVTAMFVKNLKEQAENWDGVNFTANIWMAVYYQLAGLLSRLPSDSSGSREGALFAVRVLSSRKAFNAWLNSVLTLREQSSEL
jgi:hypothetical protein